MLLAVTKPESDEARRHLADALPHLRKFLNHLTRAVEADLRETIDIIPGLETIVEAQVIKAATQVIDKQYERVAEWAR